DRRGAEGCRDQAGSSGANARFQNQEPSDRQTPIPGAIADTSSSAFWPVRFTQGPHHRRRNSPFSASSDFSASNRSQLGAKYPVLERISNGPCIAILHGRPAKEESRTSDGRLEVKLSIPGTPRNG